MRIPTCRSTGIERALCFVALAMAFGWTSTSAQVNSWITTSGNWDQPSSWSLGVLPGSSQSVLITNSGWKAVAINPSTPVNFPDSMTVGSLTIRGAWDTENTLLLNFAGTTTPLHVLNDFNIETNGRSLMLYSGLRVDNMLNLKGSFDQEGGQLIFTNSSTNTMQIEGGRFNLTNGVVTGKNMYLANDGYVNQASGLVSLDGLILGWKSSFPNTNISTYILQSGWLIVNVFEGVGQNQFGTFIQNGGTNSASDLFVDYGNYLKNGGSLFAGDVRLIAPSPQLNSFAGAILTHAGGSAIITNDLRLEGQGNRHAPQAATFNMFGGSLSVRRILMEEAGMFFQTNGTVNVANELFVGDNGGNLSSTYHLSGGNLFTSDATISSSSSEPSYITQSGGTHIVTNNLWINGTAIYLFQGGTVIASNIVLSGNIGLPPQFFIVGAPPFAVTNETISLTGGAVVIQDSAQQFGRLTIKSDSGINLAGDTAILRFADSHTSIWQGDLPGPPRLMVYNWRGSPNGGGTVQLGFGNNSSALTTSQLAQIQFVNPAGFPPGTNSARILSTGEVVPMLVPTLSLQNNGTNLMLSWSGNFILQSATNVVGPYFDITNATSPYSLNVNQSPMGFFRLRN